MKSKIKCLIVDDEPLAREGIAGYVQQIDFLELAGTCASALEALSFLNKQSVDLIFLDIQMPGLTGIDFLKSLQNPPKVIFTTAYANHAVQGFELDAVDYLLKPITFSRFLKAVNKVAEAEPTEVLEVAHKDYFFIKEDKKFIKLNFSDILFVEGVKDYVKIHCKNSRHLVLINIKNIQLHLSPQVFMRVHKSYIVSGQHIDSVDGNLIKIGAHEIPIGREYREGIDQLIKQNLIKRT